MAEIKVELNPEDVNKAVAEAIIKSVLGDEIVKAVNSQIKTYITREYENPIVKIVQQVVFEKVKDLVMTKYKTEIEDAVQKKIAGEATERIITLALEKFMKAIY